MRSSTLAGAPPAPARGAWQPGQGQNGQGQNGKQAGNQPGGQGQQPGGDSYGDENGGDPMGDPTKKSGNTKDQAVQGVQGKGGESVKETILSAADKGFSSTSYKKVYADYQKIVEEVMSQEKVPQGYKYYVKRYFQRIKPHEMD